MQNFLREVDRQVSEKALCLIFNKNIAVLKEYNIVRH